MSPVNSSPKRRNRVPDGLKEAPVGCELTIYGIVQRCLPTDGELLLDHISVKLRVELRQKPSCHFRKLLIVQVSLREELLVDIVIVAQGRSLDATVEAARSEELLESYEQVQEALVIL